MGLIEALLVFCLLCTLVYFITGLPGVPPMVRTVAYVVLCIVAILWLLNGSLGLGGFPLGRRC
jgi:hypothetical protein